MNTPLAASDVVVTSPDRRTPGSAGHLCEVVAFCDYETDRAAKARDEYGSEDAYVTRDYERLVNDPSIDVIHVCTWNVNHAEITCAVLEAAKHVMCEKPMAVTGKDARRMLEMASRRTGGTIDVGELVDAVSDELRVMSRSDVDEILTALIVRTANPARARLRAARARRMHGPEWPFADPVYWAAFVVFGTGLFDVGVR